METTFDTASPLEALAYAAEARPDVYPLSLDLAEAALLERVLANHLTELHSVIGHTDRYELRQALKADRAVIASLAERVRSMVTEVPVSVQP